MEKVRVYISLPITGYDIAERRQAAARMGAELMAEHEDWEIVNPFHVYDRLKKELLERGSFDEPDYEAIMQADLVELKKCNAAYFMRGWMESNGCKREMQCCRENDIAVAFEPDKGT